MDSLLEITCPHCDTEILVPFDGWKHACSHCGKRLDVNSLLAYLRGLDAFQEGQEIFQNIAPKKRKQFLAAEREALEIFMQAYSSLQVAFKAELEENQRMLAVEMMSSMTQEFIKRLMVSPLEAQYWNTLMVEQTAQSEYDRLKKNLEDELSGFFGLVKRWRWNSRIKTLLKSFSKLDAKLRLSKNKLILSIFRMPAIKTGNLEI